jgi:hypothetical protein
LGILLVFGVLRLCGFGDGQDLEPVPQCRDVPREDRYTCIQREGPDIWEEALYMCRFKDEGEKRDSCAKAFIQERWYRFTAGE